MKILPESEPVQPATALVVENTKDGAPRYTFDAVEFREAALDIFLAREEHRFDTFEKRYRDILAPPDRSMVRRYALPLNQYLKGNSIRFEDFGDHALLLIEAGRFDEVREFAEKHRTFLSESARGAVDQYVSMAAAYEEIIERHRVGHLADELDVRSEAVERNYQQWVQRVPAAPSRLTHARRAIKALTSH
jgi:hypothetical protein